MMKPAAGSFDSYFDVEWLSDFRHEKERLFVSANNLMIDDIQEGVRMKSNKPFLRAFTLFSSLFSGSFVANLLWKKRKRKSPQQILLDLITIYKENNGIERGADRDNGNDIKIQLYIQQLFYQLLSAFKSSTEPHRVIKSQYELLDEPLRSELWQEIGDLKLSPFLRSLCGPEQIIFMKECSWDIHGAQFEELQNGGSGHTICSEEYHFNSLAVGRLSFEFRMKKPNGTDLTGFGIAIKETDVVVDGVMSVMIDEVRWSKNGIQLIGMDKGKYIGEFAFKDSLLETVESLTVRVAVHFRKSEK